MSSFDAAAEAAQLRTHTQTIRKRRYAARRSKLDKYRAELLALHQEGARGAELQRWLHTKRIPCSLSTVLRYIQKHRG